MSRKLLTMMLIVVGWLAGARCYARTPIDPAALMETPAEQQATLNVAEAKQTFLEKYGSRAPRLWGNLDEDFLSTPGVLKNLKLAANMNNSNLAKGALRTHFYARAIADDPELKLDAVNRFRRTPIGKTDDDIIFEDRVSGAGVHIEVKDVKESTLARNLEKYEVQIDKMAEGEKLTGFRQVWVNRNGVPSELQNYAEARGVSVYKNVATGEQSLLRPGTRDFADVLGEIKRNLRLESRASIALSGDSGSISSGTEYALRNAGVSNAVAGATEGGIEGGLEGGTLAGTAWLPRAVEIGGKIIGIVGAAALVGYWGYTAYEWDNGHISTRQFVTTSTSLGGGLVGGAAGAWAGVTMGAAIGSFLPGPGTAIGGVAGAIIGGIVGGFGGSDAAEYATSSIYQFEGNKNSRKQRIELMQFLTHYYSKPAVVGIVNP